MVIAIETLHVLTPTYRPVGGVVKLLDYVQHARSLGLRVKVWSPTRPAAESPLFRIDRFADIPFAGDVEFVTGRRLDFRAKDLALISLPQNYEVVYRSLPRHVSPERVIHLVQNVRHANAAWGGGYPTRLLTRPMARISINNIVAEAISPWLDPRAFHRVINLGHDSAYFARNRAVTFRRPLRVGYTTWKSDIGDRVAESLASEDAFEFRAIRDVATWSELRALYHWSDVFLCSPGPEEGFYLPGLEAMAAGNVVVTPNVGGNMAYCKPGINCLLTELNDKGSYVDALRAVASMDGDRLASLLREGRAITGNFDLVAERREFGSFLAEVLQRVERDESSSIRR